MQNKETRLAELLSVAKELRDALVSALGFWKRGIDCTELRMSDYDEEYARERTANDLLIKADAAIKKEEGR